MKKVHYTYLILYLFVILFSSPALSQVLNDITTQHNLTPTSYFAGTFSEITYSNHTTTDTPILLISHSYGKTLIKGISKNGLSTFLIPPFISEKTGMLSLHYIIHGTTISQQKIKIIPNPLTETKIENYLGPRTILADPKHFTMIVAVPTDRYDNPKKENTPVVLKTQYKKTIQIDSLVTQDFVAWKKIYSHKKTGKLLASTLCGFTATKAIETEIQANIATPFQLNYSTNHNFADGNQITTVSTSCIKDKFDNIVNDGTFVNFIIETQNKTLLRAYGTTLNGIAKTQLLHPDHQDNYTINAYVAGIAESNTITIAYDNVATKIPYHINNYHRLITVGPIKSYMDQIIPDGIHVSLQIIHEGKTIKTIKKYTSNGYIKLHMDPNNYPKNNYSIEITTLGNSINIPNITYEN